MAKIAFIFSGQGDQIPGMGKALYDNYKVATSIFDRCEQIRANTINQCFCGTCEELAQTINTQPCLFAMEMAAATVLKDKGIEPRYVAGFSLGEIIAATFSGLFDLETGFSLVCKRARILEEASLTIEAEMAAVIKLSNEDVEKLCSNFNNIYPVNYNCPGQITVSGLKSEMLEFYSEVKKEGGRAIPLKVSGPFHTPFLTQSAALFKQEIDKANMGSLKIPLYSNKTAQLYEPNKESDLLSTQISSPVRWEAIIRDMLNKGVDTFIEIGPGKTLCNMVKKIDSTCKCFTYEQYLEG